MFKRFFLSDKNMMAAIILNAIIIFLLYFPAFSNNSVLLIADYFFVFIFLLEAIVKIIVLKPKTYFADNWNRFDFIIVLISLPSFILVRSSIIFLLRLFRLIRLVRFIKFIPHLGKIMQGLGRAMKASVFVLATLFFLNFILALFTCHFFREVAPEYFGNPLLSAYSIFQMFTLEGWNEISGLIADRTADPFFSGLFRFYFVLIVLVGGIFGLSLANAIFVDEMTLDNNLELEAKIDSLKEEIGELKAMLRRNP